MDSNGQISIKSFCRAIEAAENDEQSPLNGIWKTEGADFLLASTPIKNGDETWHKKVSVHASLGGP